MRRLIFALAWAASASAQSLPTNLRMQNVVKLFTQRTGQQVMGLGSWISGASYNDVLAGGASDHDLRLVIEKSVTPAQAQRDWQTARRVLRDLITQEFGKDANKVLGSTNLYAPNQLMKGVEDAADAMQRFQKLGQVPNLGYAGSVNSATPKYLAEGLYGEGAQVWTQMYEQRTGRLFYAVEGRAYAGMVDLTHLTEGQARYTIGGMANTSAQWAEHAAEEVAAGRGDRVAKYLERLGRDMTKAKDLARLGGDPSFSGEIRDLITRLRANPATLSSLEGRVSAVLQRSHLESAILGRMAKAGPVQGAVLNAAIAGLAAKNQFGQALSSAVAKIPAEQVIQGVMAIIIVKSGSRVAGEAGYLEAIRQTAPMFASLGTGALMGMTNWVLESAKDGGFTLVSSYQDPWDLLDGNFSAYGREGVDDGRPYTLEELVRRIHTEDALSAFVHARAMQASQRGFQGTVSAGTDKSVADGIYSRCFPQILRAWQARREQLRMEYLDLADSLRTAVYPLVVTPSSGKIPPKGGKLDVLAEVIPPSGGMLGKSLDRMQEILSILVGGHPYALVSYRWVGGTDANRESQRSYTFRTAGTQAVVCSVEISVNESSLRAGDPLIQRIPRFTAVDVEVEGEIAAPKVEIFMIDLNLRVQPVSDNKPIGPVNIANMFDFPDFMDARQLPLQADGTFHYSGRPYHDKDAAPGTVVLNPTTWHIEYSGRVNLEQWTFTVSGKWSKAHRNLKMDTQGGQWRPGATINSQQDNGDFTITSPLCARGHEEFTAGIKVSGLVTSAYQDEVNGGISFKRALASKTGRRMTDDVNGCVSYRNPTHLAKGPLDPNGYPEYYEGGEWLDRAAYGKYKTLLVFGDHVVDRSAFRFAGAKLLLPGDPAYASVGAAASPATGGASAAGSAAATNAASAAPTPSGDRAAVAASAAARQAESSPASAAPSFSVDSPAPPASALVGEGSMAGAFVTLNNSGKSHWTRCTVTIPGKKRFTLGTLPAMTGRDYAISQFKVDTSAPELSGDALVECREGSLRFPANRAP